jgi:hypothetical protein
VQNAVLRTIRDDCRGAFAVVRFTFLPSFLARAMSSHKTPHRP